MSKPREPLVSIVLAVRNEAPYITRCLAAVLAQDWPTSHTEILVADGESTDGTLDSIRRLPGSESIQVLTNPRRNQAAGLNLAIAQARGDVIVRVDGHTEIAPDYVRCCVAALHETGAACVGGRIEPVGLTSTGKVIAAVARTAFATPGAFHISRVARFTDTVYLGAWPAEALARAGGYDERLRANEDYELAYRIRQAGGCIYLSPAIQSRYFGRQNLAALARQYTIYGIGKAQMLLKHPASLRIRQLVAPLFVAGLIVGAAAWPIAPVAHLLWLVLVAAYVTLNLSFSAYILGRERPSRAWLAPVVYLVIHLSWGIGFWSGLLLQLRWSLRLRHRLALSPHA